MMARRDLKSRLARFDRGGAAAAQPQRALVHEEGIAAEARTPEAILGRGARYQGSGSGAYLRLEASVDPVRFPGAPRDCVSAEAWERLGGGAPPEGTRWAILDTETTGLQSGAGTLVFLVGLLHWRSDGARLVQYLLPEPAGEARLLEDLWTDLEQVDALLSFNGRAFDRSRLANRAILHRLDPATLDLPHLDLIHPARRVAAGWLPDCRLGSLERGLLGVQREDDLPGHEVPEAYRSWLLEGVEEGLLAVLDHNRMDVENLMALAGELARFFEDGEDPLPLPAEAQLALGRTLLARGRTEAARLRFAEALRGAEDDLARRALEFLAREHRRARDYEAAARLHREAIERWPLWIEARIELAKLQEHRLGELEGAVRSVTEALQQLERREGLGADVARTAELRRGLVHRLERLRSRTRGGPLRW